MCGAPAHTEAGSRNESLQARMVKEGGKHPSIPCKSQLSSTIGVKLARNSSATQEIKLLPLQSKGKVIQLEVEAAAGSESEYLFLF